MIEFSKDIRFAGRILVRSPGFTSASVAVLAIGIAAVTVIFSTLNSVVLQPLPYDDPSELTWMWGSSEVRPRNTISALNYWDYRQEADAFESLAAILAFSTLGVSTRAGRSFSPEEEWAGSERVVIVSDGFRRRHFAGTGGIVGSSITLNGEPFEIVGVLPPDFEFRKDVDLWFPMQHEDALSVGRSNNNFRVFGRLHDGVSADQAQAQLNMIASRLQDTHPDTNDGWGVTLQSMHEVLVGSARGSLTILLGLVGIVLLIACANVASLSLGRGMTRRNEVAVRFSLGAARSRVIRQLLTENSLVALAGGGGGLALAWFGLCVLRKWGPANLPRLDTIGVDVRVLTFTFAVTLLTSLLFGIIPALRSTNIPLSETLKVGGMRGTSQFKARFQNALVITQVALSLVLMAASGLLVRSYFGLQRVDPGFVAEGAVRAEIQLPNWRYEAPEEIANAWSQLEERLRAIPGVSSVGAVDQTPIRTGGTWNTIYPVERPPTDAAESAHFGAQRRFASNNYFEALEIPILMGRAFESSDRPGSTPVIIINATMAERWFPNELPLGKELSVWGQNWQVVGVADDVREFGLARDFVPVFYMAARQIATDRMQLLVRTSSDPSALADDLRRAVWEFDNSIPISALETMESRISDSLAQPRFQMMLVGLFAGVALILAATGVYGIIALFVRQRIRELGIRVALGAAPRDVIAVVLRRGSWLIGLGIGIGLVAGLAGGRLMQSLLFEVAPTDLLTFAAVSMCMVFVGLMACILPARRAVKADPQEVLRVD